MPSTAGSRFLVCYAATQLATQVQQKRIQVVRSNKVAQKVWFLVCYAATQLTIQLQQECIRVVCSTREAWKRPAESNGTPAMDIGFEDIRKRRYTDKRGKEQNTRP